MRIEKCYFCSCSVYPGHGLTFIRNDSKAFNFCRSKCHRAFKKKWNPRKTRWTKAFRKSTGKELSVDPIFEFEQKRNTPIIYSRTIWKHSVIAIKKVEEVANKRKELYLLKRFDQTRERTTENNEIEVIKDKVLITEPKESFKNKIFDAVKLHRSNELKSKTEPLMFMMEST
uniref:Probable ribosome biogenesis protein RLP24 n=1 Tax=Myxobolus squamalis TaxID=59785 RepID=A0A6B2G1F8_MYXSQ